MTNSLATQQKLLNTKEVEDFFKLKYVYLSVYTYKYNIYIHIILHNVSVKYVKSGC